MSHPGSEESFQSLKLSSILPGLKDRRDPFAVGQQKDPFFNNTATPTVSVSPGPLRQDCRSLQRMQTPGCWDPRAGSHQAITDYEFHENGSSPPESKQPRKSCNLSPVF
jgi:hypothetical protein